MANAKLTGTGPSENQETINAAPGVRVERMVMPFSDIVVGCCSGAEAGNCLCGQKERVLRAFSEGRDTGRQMTPEEREWCLDESDKAGEGSYPREEAVDFSDKDLAMRVLYAWRDYVRSNCI